MASPLTTAQRNAVSSGGAVSMIYIRAELPGGTKGIWTGLVAYNVNDAGVTDGAGAVNYLPMGNADGLVAFEQVGDLSAPAFTIRFPTGPNSNLTELVDYTSGWAQRKTTVFIGIHQKGSLLLEPPLLVRYRGYFNQATPVKPAKGGRWSMELEVESHARMLLRRASSRVRSHHDQRAAYPGDEGLEHTNKTDIALEWGSELDSKTRRSIGMEGRHFNHKYTKRR